MIIRRAGGPCPCAVGRVLSAVLLAGVFLAGCGGDNAPLYGDLDLTGVPLSTEMSGPVTAALSRLDRVDTDDLPAGRILARYYSLSHAINDLDPAAAVDSLLAFWAHTPDNFLWIDLGLRRARTLGVDSRLEEILALPVLNDTTTAVGCFRMGREHYRQETGGRWLLRSHALAGQLDDLQRIWLDKLLTMVDRDALRPEDGVRRLLVQLEPARRRGGRRLEFDLWITITNCLIAGDHLDDALHAVVLAGALATRADDVYLQTRAEFWLGRVFLARQELVAAGHHFQAALALAEQHQFNWQRKAAGYRAALVLDALGDYPGVLTVDRANLALMRATADSLNIPRFLLNIANTHRQMGQLDSCRVYQAEAVRCVELYPHPANVARIPLMIAEYHAQVGQYARMDSLLQVALDNPVNSRVVEEAVKLHVNLIRGGLEQGRPDLVQRSISQVDSLRNLARETGGRIKVDYRADLLIAEFYAGQNEFARAGIYLDRAAVTLATTDSPEARWSLLRGQGLLARQRGDLPSALAAFSAAHDLIATVDNPDLQARSRFLLGSALLEAGDFAAARGLFPPDETRGQFGGRFRTRLASQLFRGMSYARAGDHREARRQLQIALDMCSPWSPPDLVARTRLELGRTQVALGQVASGAQQLHAAWDLLLAGVPDQEQSEIFHGDLRREMVEALISLYLTHPEMSPRGDVARATLALRGALETPVPITWQPGQLVYFWGERGGYRWAVGAQGVTVRVLPSANDMAPLVNPVLSDLTRPGRTVPTAFLHRLADVLLMGGETVWAKGEILYLVQDGPLAGVPWAALPLPESFGEDAGKLVLERGPLVFHLLPVADLASPAAVHRPLPSDRLLAVGANTAGGEGLGVLYQAETEAAAIGKLWTTGPTRVLLGREASWQAMAGLDLGSFKAIHLASHARVHRGLPEQSYLVLSGSLGPEQLTAGTVAKLNLTADLVYLSCCEAAADVGGGGLVGGFVQAFINAGAGSVIASSQGVDDTASRFLAERVYGHWLAGADLPQALRLGQLDLQNADPRWSHPFYWSFYRIYQ